jgi:hypothetical protein
MRPERVRGNRGPVARYSFRMSEATAQEGPLAREGEHIAPSLGSKSFHCTHCGVLAEQDWSRLVIDAYVNIETPYWRCSCRNCRGKSAWTETDGGRMLDPLVGGGPRPHLEMPGDVKDDYEEARRIVKLSPRGACGLLRLAVQKLCVDLGESGNDLNTDIGNLVRKGLDQEVQEALDSLRVIGNEAVHPGEMDLRDDVETATNLFDLLNFVVDDMIAQPKKRRAIFASLPQRKRDGIEQRDRQ